MVDLIISAVILPARKGEIEAGLDNVRAPVKIQTEMQKFSCLPLAPKSLNWFLRE